MKKYLKYVLPAVFLVIAIILVLTSLNKTTQKENSFTCSITVECSEILTDMDSLVEEKHSLVPDDGVMYKAADISFSEGETAFELLKKELKKAKIPLDFSITPVYNTAYIKGIGNIYEKDCGERSGWLYFVNNESPSVGSSGYKICDGDEIVFTYKIKTY